MIDWTTPWNRELFAFVLKGSCFGLLYILSVYMPLVTSPQRVERRVWASSPCPLAALLS